MFTVLPGLDPCIHPMPLRALAILDCAAYPALMSDERQYAVYILCNRRQGTLYIGVTGDLVRRIHQHRTDAVEGFTKRYVVHRLVHFELFPEPRPAIQREKTLKHWPRRWKVALIEGGNPEWMDLYPTICR